MIFPWPGATAVGGWWNRAFNPEIDLIGADRAPIVREIYYTGSVKWLDRPFDDHDFAALQRDAIAVPGFEPGRTPSHGIPGRRGKRRFPETGTVLGTTRRHRRVLSKRRNARQG